MFQKVEAAALDKYNLFIHLYCFIFVAKRNESTLLVALES